MTASGPRTPGDHAPGHRPSRAFLDGDLPVTSTADPGSSAPPMGAAQASTPSAPTIDAVIDVRDLRKRYGDVNAVDGVTFHVRKGEVFGLLGPNGAGKTTTVEILEGLRAPDAGEVRVLGLDVSRDAGALKERIGLALQTAALYPRLTVRELLELFASFYQRARPVSELLELLDLGEKRNAQTKVLSGGQRQRLSVALALINEPELVFLDEPTTGLDPAARRALWDIIEAQKRDGRTVLLTTHYLEEAESCATASRSWTTGGSSTWAPSTRSSPAGSRNARSGSTRSRVSMTDASRPCPA